MWGGVEAGKIRKRRGKEVWQDREREKEKIREEGVKEDGRRQDEKDKDEERGD